jgi:glycosyltransferase involved in cell wall biosynthesis
MKFSPMPATQSNLLVDIKRRLQSYKPYLLARELRASFRRVRTIEMETQIVSLRPDNPPRGNVILSYILDPFLLRPGQAVPNTHSNHWESLLMTRTFLEMGYAVDVISHLNRSFVPEKPYSFVIDSRWNLQRLAPLLNSDCLKVMHIDVCHILFQNAAEAARLLAVQQRRGVTLMPRRFEVPNLAMEHADCATILGNEFTINTFRYANKPLYPVPIIPSACYPWPEGKDFEACRKRFLWFGSGGLVRKGLDLVLEAFAGMPDYHLTICGPIGKDKDFERAYQKELYETPNIETVGWVDIDGPGFRDICRRSVAMIYPSCAEGQCGGVVTCMHAGLIPVISYESGVDVHDFGMILHDCSIQEIQNAVRRVSNFPAKELEQMARAAWEYARANHSREKFALEYRKAVEHILATAASEALGAERLANGTPQCHKLMPRIPIK